MHNSSKKKLFVIVGPTGVGKTDLSIEVARMLNTEIVSADSRQIYKELRIGTAVPSAEQLARVRHHFIQNKSVYDYYNASMYEFKALELLTVLFETYDNVVLTGGSMLYVDALCKGIDDLPTVDMDLRNSLTERLEREGLESLRFELQRLDPEYYAIADLKNPKRILKALEVCLMTGYTYTSFRTNTVKQRDFEIVKIGLNRERDELHRRINHRVDLMIAGGLIDEARQFYKDKSLNALNTVGYKELFAHWDGEYDFDTAIELIKRNTRRYARRQITWFGKDMATKWFTPDDLSEIKHYVAGFVSKNFIKTLNSESQGLAG